MAPVTLPLSSGGTLALRPSKIIALGLNYRAHVAESASVDVRNFTSEIPGEPILFPKTPNVLIGPDEPIVLPRLVRDYGFATPRTDHEAELALVIGRGGKDIPPERVREHVLGFTCFNDVSQRNFQKTDKSGWFRGKSLDTFGPIGPRVVTWDELGDPQNLDIRCRKNGQVVQQGNTREMIFTITELTAFISRNFRLEAGDIITTGTPAGVSPLSHGDVVEVEIEGIGVLRNVVQEED